MSLIQMANQINESEEVETKCIELTMKKKDDVVVGCSMPFGSSCNVLTKYDIVNCQDKLEYYMCTSTDDDKFVDQAPRDYLSQTYENGDKWNKLIHPDHFIELQIMFGMTKIDSIMVGQTKLIPIKKIKRRINSNEYSIDVLSVAENEYGIMGVELLHSGKLYHIGNIYLNPDQVELYTVVEEIPRYY